VLTFIFGAFIGRLGDKLGCKTRLWLALGTLIQTVFTMAAAISIWQAHQGSVADSRANPAWTNTLSFVCVGFMSASMGLQGIMGKRVNTQFTTTGAFQASSCYPIVIDFSCSCAHDDLV
jgi:MFS family permease